MSAENKGWNRLNKVWELAASKKFIPTWALIGLSVCGYIAIPWWILALMVGGATCLNSAEKMAYIWKEAKK